MLTFVVGHKEHWPSFAQLFGAFPVDMGCDLGCLGGTGRSLSENREVPLNFQF